MNESEIKEKLIQYGKKYIELNELAKVLGIRIYDTEYLYETVRSLETAGLIFSIKSSDTNGNITYPLYKKYKIVAEKKTVDPLIIDKINCLHPIMLRSGHLSSHVKDFVENEEIITSLSRFFFSDESDIFISRKERSFSIFGKEKVLDDSKVKALLYKLGITASELKLYDTPEYCFHDYIPQKKDEMTLLICENKDIWFNIRRLMFEDGADSLFKVKLDGVVLGNGNEVTQKKGALTEYVRFMGSPKVRFLYWGDIDIEGFDIYKRVKEVNSSLDITLFVPGYRKMIERALILEKEQGLIFEDSSSLRLFGKLPKELLGEELDCFTPEEVEFLNVVFFNNKLIPQEIISYAELE